MCDRTSPQSSYAWPYLCRRVNQIKEMSMPTHRTVKKVIRALLSHSFPTLTSALGQVIVLV